MGNFYTNFEVFGGDASDVLRVAKELRRRAYVVSDENGDTLLFDAICDDQDVDEIERLGTQLVDRLQRPILASLNHDDDHLWLWLFHSDNVTRYKSLPQAFVFGWKLSRIRGGMLCFPLISAVLAFPTFIFQVIRHSLLIKVTGLSPICAGLGYTNLSEGEWPLGLTEDEIKRA
jgi:hypothetical protein